jgi:peptidoglycan/LPS O-acetylase OafA/YrhL
MALNLGMVNYWGLQDDYSFNGPTWSLSIELLLYVLFFGVCRFLPSGPATAIGISWLGFFFVSKRYMTIGAAIGQFFAGGFVFFVFERLAVLETRRRKFLLLCCVLFSWGMGLFIFSVPNALFSRFPIAAKVSYLLPRMWPGIRNSSLILTAALTETYLFSRPFRSLAILGDISYSVYVIHFPLQLVLNIFVRLATSDTARIQTIFYNPAFFCLYMCVLAALSHISYNFFEQPVQSKMRSFTAQSIGPRTLENPQVTSSDGP